MKYSEKQPVTRILFFLTFILLFPFAFVKAQCVQADAAYIVDGVLEADGSCTFNVDVNYGAFSSGGNASIKVSIRTSSGTVLVNKQCIGGISGAGVASYGPFTGIDCSEEIIVSWQGYANPSCGGGNCPSGNITTTSVATALPVELVDFSAGGKASGVVLNWATASEENNDYFSVEHSLNGKDFLEIGIVNGNGTTNNLQYYTFIHDAPGLGNNYYRLKQVDLGGVGYMYSSVVVVETIDETKKVRAYPSTVLEQVHLDFFERPKESIEVTVVALSGKVVASKRFSGDAYLEDVDLSSLVAGLYQIRVFFVESGRMEVRQVVKVRG